MSDAHLRQLEREAACGDEEAAKAFAEEQRRTKAWCVCPAKPCVFCTLPLDERLARTNACTRPADWGFSLCGFPLPCPRHEGKYR